MPETPLPVPPPLESSSVGGALAKFDLERTARILSLVAIPIVVAVVGTLIQSAVARNSVARDYVQLAVNILTSEKEKAPPGLRSWAVDLLNQNSPTKFSAEVIAQLKAGDISLPWALLAGSNSAELVISPDGKYLAKADDSTIRIWDVNSGKQIGTLSGHTAPISVLAFSPDGSQLLSGSMDETCRLWSLPSMSEIKRLKFNSPVVAAAFSPDGQNLITRGADGEIIYQRLETGEILRRIRVNGESSGR